VSTTASRETAAPDQLPLVRPPRRRSPIGYFLVSGYVVLTVFFGIAPALYAVYLSLTDADGAIAPTANFAKVLDDFRFLPALTHVTLFMVIWIAMLVVLVVALAILVHSVRVRWLSSTARLVFYLPGALAGASSVLLWLFVLDPNAGPVGALLRLFGFQSFNNVIAPGHLPVIFAIIAFWTGAGGWIVVMYGALNNISEDMIAAAGIDGAGPAQIAMYIQLPLLRKWIAYMAVISLAGGTQLFVEPQLLSSASSGVVSNDYSLNQLAYLYAFEQGDFNGSAAISVLLLIVSLLLSAVFVFRGGLFETE